MKYLRLFLIQVVATICCLPIAALAGTLADTPLSLKSAVPPNVMFALSVEFPTANTAAYQGTSNYTENTTFLGYFDSEKCYGYDTTNGWFYPTAVANAHVCSGWSGNFLNWATMTGLDEFRFAMSGGNRYQDTSTLTVLERSYQSGQGGTSNFPDKTFTEDGNTTVFPSSTELTIKNQGKGVQMTVYPDGANVANCTGPSVSNGTFSCAALTLASDGTTGSCNTWSGNGSSASPYKCTSFGAFGGVTPSTASTKTTSVATTGTPTSTSVTCSSPGLSPGPFNCTLALPNGHTGSCSSWAGDGSVGAPFTCATFGTFSGGETFSPSGSSGTSSFSGGTYGPPVTETVTCSVTNHGGISCNPINGNDTASCSRNSLVGNGNNNNPYRCPSFGFTGDEYFVSVQPSGPTTYNNKKYFLTNTITYKLPAPAYYVSSYSGTTGTSYRYVSSYDIGFGTAQTFNVRVKVCDSSVGMESNCKQYGSSWKPTGVLQDNGDRMRFGVMSYFNANDIDNAVLRSKLKYVAPQKYSSATNTVTNPNAEWSASDGTLIVNPDSTDNATANSFVGSVSNTGVINYINKFGSTTQSYKTYDDVGKLYYEALKYIRGKSPTTAFYNGAKSSNSDGFPVITSWDDPVQYTCQKNYIISMGDTHTWCDKRLPGDTHTTGNNSVCNAYTDANSNAHSADYGSLAGDSSIDVASLTNVVGGLEGMGNIATSYTGVGNAGYGMAGLSSWAASHDIRPDLLGTQNVQSYVIDVQENKDCGYRSQYWLTAKYGKPDGYDSSGAWITNNNPAMSTTTLPAGNCASNTPPGYDAAGGTVTWPKNLLRASDPSSMIASVKAAVSDIAAQIGDEAALSQSSGSLDAGTGAYIYRATYNSGGWQGDVQALGIDTSGVINSTPAWKASSMLPAAVSRNIVTYNDGLAEDGTTETSDHAKSGVYFTADNLNNLSSGQQAKLNQNEFGTADILAADRINWLRGDQSKEAYLPGTTTANPNPNDGFRSRESLLGDVINSNPVFVGPPAFLSGTGYATFANAIYDRTPMIYVGGNDGMLHGYDASYTISADGVPSPTNSSGKELLAYVPSSVYGKLSQLMAPNYSHKYYVDGSPVVGEACFGNTAGTECSASTAWKTMLVGGLNAGGQGVYALDVTDPTAFAPSKVLWEFTDKDDPDLGYTFSKPIIKKLNNQKWAVIFGNGFNNTFADSSVSTTGRAYLYILYVDGPGTGNPWVLNTNYFKIPLISPTEPDTPLNPPNGLSSVTGLDRDQSGTVDYIYAGDRIGNIWKVDLTSATAGNWHVSFGTANAPQPLFTATTGGSGVQQITTGIEVAKHPNGGYMLMFGTGSWVDTADAISPFSTDSFYGIWDKDDGTKVAGRSSLQKEAVITHVNADGESCTMGTSGCYVVMSNCMPNYTTANQTTTATALCPDSLKAADGTGQQRGYYFDLPGTGERTRSTKPSVTGGVVTFTTLTPATDPCSGNTIGVEYNLNFLSGGEPARGVYLLDGNVSGIVNATIDGESVPVRPSGTVIVGGASDNPVAFDGRPPQAKLPDACSTVPALPATHCTGAACQNYVAGWGFLANLQGASSICSKKYMLTCLPPEFGGGDPVCTWKSKSGQIGRLGWKQINR